MIGFLVDIQNIPNLFSRNREKGREEGKREIFIPTFPSSILSKVPTKWMDEPDLCNTYEWTVFFLQEIYHISDKKILSNPLYRVVEDEKVVGVITMTNQFIPILPLVDNRDFGDSLKVLYSDNPITVDRDITIPSLLKEGSNPTKKVSREWTEKMRMVRNIRLETEFYQAFRNTIRILLNIYRNRNIREEIREMILNPLATYLEKRRFVELNIRKIAKGMFVFQEYSEEVLEKIPEVFLCSDFDGSAPRSSYCLLMNASNGGKEGKEKGEGKEPSLILPLRNLVNIEERNEPNYYRRLSDELIRFKRIRLFMMYPDSYLPLTSGEYKINDDEFVIPKSMLTEEYFSELKRYPLEKYVQTNTFETANPSSSIPANPTLLWMDAYQRVRK